VKNDARRGLNQIIFVHRIQREYGDLARHAVDQEAAFERRLAQLEKTIARELQQTLVGIASAVDAGIEEMLHLHDNLEEARREVRRATEPWNRTVQPFLAGSVRELKRWKQSISQLLETFPDAVARVEKPFKIQEIQGVVDAVREQAEGVTALGAKFAAFDERLRRRRPGEGERDADHHRAMSQAGRLRDAYERFQEDRGRDLARRNQNAEEFKDAQAAMTGGTGFGGQGPARSAPAPGAWAGGGGGGAGSQTRQAPPWMR
jgi:hypothetical protein